MMEMVSDRAVTPAVGKEGFKGKNKLNHWLNEKCSESTDSTTVSFCN